MAVDCGLTAAAEHQKSRDGLCWLGKPEGTFVNSIGGDGAPFGKSQEATAYCVSLLNEGQRIYLRRFLAVLS